MKLSDEVLAVFALLWMYCAPEPASKNSSRHDPTEVAIDLGQDMPDGEVVERLDRWSTVASRQSEVHVTLRGTSGRRTDKMRSDMPSPFLSFTPPH